ncbi:MAG: site-2 protease family protein [Candidatus Micrarchaeia archaeon]
MRNLFGNENLDSFKMDRREAVEILICIFTLALAATIAFNPFGILIFLKPVPLLIFWIVFSFTIGVGFVLHELSHKAVAVYYGASARFVMWPQGLAFMLLTSLFGFIFAAPGAVYIYAKSITNKQNGIISIAGPAINLLLSFAFIFFQTLSKSQFGFGFDHFYGLNIWLFGAYINALLAAFNLLPIGPLDGAKVFRWSKLIWAGVFLFSLWLMFNLGGALILG